MLVGVCEVLWRVRKIGWGRDLEDFEVGTAHNEGSGVLVGDGSVLTPDRMRGSIDGKRWRHSADIAATSAKLTTNKTT